MGGGRCFGFEVGGQELRAAEVALIREVAQRMIAGGPTSPVARDLTARGVRTSRGTTFTQTTCCD